MDQQKKLILLSLLLLSSYKVIAVVDNTLKKQVVDAKPMGLYQVLEGAKVVAFSKDFLIKGGLDAKDLKKWEDLTATSNELVHDALAKGEVPAQYQEYLDSIHAASVFFKNSVNLLHEKYGKVGFKKIKDTVVATLDKTSVSIEELKKIVQDCTVHQKDMSEIIKNILNSIVSPKAWANNYYTKAGDLKDSKDVLRNYLTIIKDFKNSKKNILTLLNKYGINSLDKAKKFIDDLEGIEYIMKAKLLAEEKPERRENLETLREIMIKTRELYPDFLSVQEIAKLGDADKVATIIFAQAGAYESVLSQLNREARAILFAAQNKEKK